MCCYSADLTLLESNYTDILQSFPEDYKQTLITLHHSFSDDLIINALNSSCATVANKMMLNYLMDSLKCNDDILQLCNQLEKVSDSPILLKIISDLRKGKSNCTIVKL